MNPQLSVLRFSPDPEQTEYINVALLFENGKTNLIYEPNFSRLTQLIPTFDIKLLAYYLQDIQARISLGSFPHAMRLITQESSQFICTAPQSLLPPVSKEIIQTLKRKYLERPKLGPSSQKRFRVENSLTKYLTQNLDIAQEWIISGASPKNFMSSDVAAKLGSNGIHIAKAVKTQHHILLVDGIDCKANKIESIENRGQKIASSYYRLGRIRKDIQSAGQELKRISVLLNKPLANGNDRLEFVIKMLTNESDELINPKEGLSRSFMDWLSKLRSEIPQPSTFL